ncbi:MAG: DNA (cytosine-5-)-methyltransferase [Chloroflexota bacterium]
MATNEPSPDRVPASHRDREPHDDPTFRFVDLFAGIGGIRAGLEHPRGACVFTVEKDPAAILTYEANWGQVDARDIRDVHPVDIPEHEVMAAGFPCTPFSLAGVSRKNWANRAHGFKDEKAGNLFFQIVKLIGGPYHEEASIDETRPLSDEEEASAFQAAAPAWDSAPPVLLLENVRHLIAHDERRTFRVIRRRLMQSGYLVNHRVINGAIWVPQNRQRTVIVALRADLFEGGGKFVFQEPGDPKAGPKLDDGVLEPDGDALERYRLTDGVWKALRAHRERHEGKGSGFGYSIAERDGVTRTLSARYYKDGAEILLRMPDGGRPRRLTPREAARLMGFTREHLAFDFEIPVSDVQAYKQFGNSVVVPQFQWIADRIVERADDLFAERMARARVRTE